MVATPKTRTKRHGRKPGKARKGSKADLRARTYQSWNNMLQRCYNPKHVSYQEYGGRGIEVCVRWRPKLASNGVGDTEIGETEVPEVIRFERAIAFACFVADVGVKPSWRHTLDRSDANGHYEPTNCKWATPKEQGVNKRSTHFVLHPKTGQRIAAATLADELKISYQQLRARMMKAGTWYALRDKAIDVTVILKPGGEPL